MGPGRARVRGVVGYKPGDSEGSAVLKPSVPGILDPSALRSLLSSLQSGTPVGFFGSSTEPRSNHVGGFGVAGVPRNR